MFHLESEGLIAPGSCVYAYTVGLDSRLRVLADWSVHIGSVALG
jgi:hypothetical protein